MNKYMKGSWFLVSSDNKLKSDRLTDCSTRKIIKNTAGDLKEKINNNNKASLEAFLCRRRLSQEEKTR